MRVPYNWLREYVPVELDPQELADKMSMAGIAVEELDDPGALYRELRVGEVCSLQPHPRAEKLLVCRVKLSDGEITVVTAARNLKAGDKVPVALSGMRLPDGTVIEEVDFQGIVSQGMLCSEEELGLSRKAEGIMVLPPETALTDDLATRLGLDSPVLILELTPNRADCYGMLGVAREVAALTGCRLNPPELTVVEETNRKIEDFIDVELHDPELCPRYTGRVFFDLQVGESPLWLKTRLLAAGMRPVNNVVDLTNYVMWELNQPLHAFDLDRLAGKKILVRRAGKGEHLVTLDGVERILTPEDLVIADAEKAQGIAGIMGGEASEVSPQTRTVFLESAYFSPVNTRRTAQNLVLHSEAALRFGKGLDPEGTPAALNRMAHLLTKIDAGCTAAGLIDLYPRPVPARKVRLRTERVNSLLGLDLEAGYMAEILQRLNFGISKEEERVLQVEIPSYRLDIENEADLAEEIARLHGYDKIPPTYPAAKRPGALTPRQLWEKQVRDLMQGYGFSEVVTYSFHGEKTFDRLNLPTDDPLRHAVRLKIPLSEVGSLMRTTLLGSILEVLSYNSKRKIDNLCLFELARVYFPAGDEESLPQEDLHLAGGMMGLINEKGWNQTARQADFYDGKGVLEALLTELKVKDWGFERGEHPTLHPGRTAFLTVQGKRAGVIGEIHPEVKEAFDLNFPVILFELDIEEIWVAVEREIIQVNPLPKFPPVLRDIALVLPAGIPVAEVMRLVQATGGRILEKVELFDVYSGGAIPKDRRSLAFSLIFRLPERTLQDDEVNEVLEKIITRLAEEYDAEVRR
ncbi:MAG: phenylalanine--tRNA ligase subunit beta [Firmicutes bacterium]|nr:phenylalanine--tRNA ligase subunit beta [Bacillota bacterium]